MKIFAMIILLISLPNSIAQPRDTLRPNQTLRDNGETLVSAGETFELGFFSPKNSNQNKRYVGIWFKNIPQNTIVWVANRDNPITDTSPSANHFLTITETGNILILSNNSETPIWSSNSSASRNPILQLLTSGNLVLRDGEDKGENYAWESFDHPCDTLISGMKLGWNLETGRTWRLSSWTSPEDPSTGTYTYEIDPRLPQLVQRRGSKIKFRSGSWDGTRFGGDRDLKDNPVFRPMVVSNETHVYYSFENTDASALTTRFWVNPSGVIQQMSWSHGAREWVSMFDVQNDECDSFGRCGPNGMCHEEADPICRCPSGFVPRLVDDWARLDWTGGCQLRKAVNCSGGADMAGAGFRKLSGVKLPYGLEFSVDRTVRTRRDCEGVCRRNCSCVAFALAGESGCVVWFGDLLDMRIYNRGVQDLYIKLVASELGLDDNLKMKAVIISMSVVSGSIIILFLVGLFIIRKRTSCSHSHENKIINSKIEESHKSPVFLEEDLELPSFGLDVIASATNFFSSTHKIGEGGFGPVYKGVLPTGQEIAVKRLSKDSGQGLAEFKNEVILMAKLQHRNLVRLLGCCIHKEDRMLIYEYMLKKSLDLYIFNQTRGSALDWSKRFDIIVGIARGLLYLHRDSRLRIIHRDLKASNILLDDEMNPKISDFGLARIFGGEQTEVNTNRVVGTYGYMSPEYAIDGHFSVKSDVFSYGVMVLEIVSGKKNRGFEHPEHDLNLLGHAWKLWNDGRPMNLIDVLMENVPVSEVLRCIQVGLLCVQKRPEERPLMSSVLFMLDSENASLPQPKQPGFYTERSFTETDSSSSSNIPYVSTEITVTTFQGR